MNVREINELLSRGEINHPQLFPHLIELAQKKAQFSFEFGLDSLPKEPGLLIIRGPRQYGKSTWLEMQLQASVKEWKAGSTYYLNGDEIVSEDRFVEELITLHHSYSKDAPLKRLFIDEVTAMTEWQRGIKRVWDRGYLHDVLIITTGSKAEDLRRGSEKLPGRKGKLPQHEYIFLPISYREFHRMCHKKLGQKTLISYLLTGGSPIAGDEIFTVGRIPEYVIQLTRDWIVGDIVKSGRSRVSLFNIMQGLFRFGTNPVGYAKLARETGLANNTIASGYIEHLTDLMSILPSWPWDENKRILILRKPCKFHFINLAVAIAFHEAGIRSPDAFTALPSTYQGMFYEWLVAQEIWRRSVLARIDNPEAIGFWQSKEHEVDFVTPKNNFIEVKRGTSGPIEFTWFAKTFPKKQLTVICQNTFETEQVRGITMEDFLLSFVKA